MVHPPPCFAATILPPSFLSSRRFFISWCNRSKTAKNTANKYIESPPSVMGLIETPEKNQSVFRGAPFYLFGPLRELLGVS